MRQRSAENDAIKRDVIAVKQLHALKNLRGPREKPLGLSDVKKMFAQKAQTSEAIR